MKYQMLEELHRAVVRAPGSGPEPSQHRPRERLKRGLPVAGITCDYCGEGDSGSKGPVLVYNGGIHQFHSECKKKYDEEQREG